MKPTDASVPVKGWALLAAISAVVGAGVTKATVFSAQPGSHVLGEKQIAATTSSNGNGNGGVGNGNGNGNQPTISIVAATPTTVRPGVSSPVDVTIKNNNNFAISVTQISVVAPFSLSPAVSGCSAADFTAVAYSGAPIPVGKNATVQLSKTTVASTAWPQIVMTNTSANQDRCQGATYTLSLTATAVKA